MTLAQLQVFIAVAEAKSFTRAADTLSFTQSAVSQMILSLEKELGVPLFNRGRKGVSTTAIGERMLKQAREILQIISCMKQEASASKGIETGTLRIGSIHTVSTRLLPCLIGSFRKLYPQVEIVLFEGEYAEVNSWITSSVVDVAFTTKPAPEMDYTRLTRDEMMVFVPEDHPLRHEPSLTFSQIQDKCFLMPKDECIKKLLLDHGLASTITLEVRDVTTLLAMVQEWVGVTILPELYMPETLPRVVAIPLRPAITRELVIATRSFDQISPVAAEFILHTQHYLNMHGPAPAP
ncbi:LysR family transcriptional regulator [Brevibacillus ruminantium]|uniref:LysR family transcriptional regulator n=1 Tax=Brevibacillus ruminantium TaxID=2950604 RepID=A0ABY4WD56_9BACL|nr:LysR family transcriptional regulator [Brevibacillus ruminantium]USG65002.1 LysR family transcriptional regulator [Brevibacillus ruminantium]